MAEQVIESQVTEQTAPKAGAWSSVTVDGVTVDANTGTEAELRAEMEAERKPVEKPVAEAKPVEQKPKPRNDPQARIDQAIARQKDAERRAEAAERRAAELAAGKPVEKPAEKAVAAPKAEKFQTFEAYLGANPEASLEDYMEARDEWKDARKAAVAQEREQSEAQTRGLESQVKTFNDRLQKELGDDPDERESFLEAVEPKLLEASPMSALPKGSTPTISNFLAEQILISDHPKALLLHLSDPKVVQRLATLHPNAVIRELAKFELSLGAAPAGPVVKDKPVSKATAPIVPVKGSSHVADAEPGDDASDDEWYRHQQAKRRR